MGCCCGKEAVGVKETSKAASNGTQPTTNSCSTAPKLAKPKVTIDNPKMVLVKNLYHTDPNRIKVVLKFDGDHTGDGELSWDTSEIKIFSADKNGAETGISPHTLANADLKLGKSLYIEGIKASGSVNGTTITLKGGDSNAESATDKLICGELKLIIYKGRKQLGVAPDVILDTDKLTKGRFLHVQDGGNKQGRALLQAKVNPDGCFNGKVTFKVNDNSKLELFDDETAGSKQANPYKLDYAEDLEKVWAQGKTESDALCDIEIDLGIDGIDLVADKVKATVVKIKEVTPTADNYKQYVNLPAQAGHPEYDRKFKPIATLTKALQGVKLYFNIEPDSSNNVDIPDTLKHKEIADNARVAVETNVSGAASGVIELSRYGGDKFKAAAYLEEDSRAGKANPTKSKDIEVWQQIAYQYDAMQTNDTRDYIGAKDTAAFEAEFKNCFIEMNKIAETTPAHRRVIPDDKKDAWVTSNKNVNLPGDRAVYIALVDAIGGGPQKLNTLYFNTIAGGTSHDFDINNWVIHISDNSWFVSVNYQENIPPHTTMSLDQGKATLVQNGDIYKLTLDLTALSNAKNYNIEFNFNSYNPISGLSWGEKVLVDVRLKYTFGYTVHDSVLNTVLHEVGHFLGLAAQKNTDNAKTINGNYYFQNGNHCNYNTDKCIMFHNAVQTNLAFCPGCKKALQARNLSSPQIWGTADF
jgi:hypothetical protein